MRLIQKRYIFHVVEPDSPHPTKIEVDMDEVGGIDVNIPRRSRDRKDFTALLRIIADDLDKYFPD